jgi:hypothetical protein
MVVMYACESAHADEPVGSRAILDDHGPLPNAGQPFGIKALRHRACCRCLSAR